MFKETRRRSVQKSLYWRVIAFVNTWAVLSMHITENALYNSIIVNVIGTICFYAYERIWNKSVKGRYAEK